jgi:hypothetical protein
MQRRFGSLSVVGIVAGNACNNRCRAISTSSANGK